ncbi:hypothetical protein FTUN_4175 [Frigoriglobus tundricola]|uniref:Uncharacterized protein n=1 Tax=Frigoriglobus tundricola TaxID=2774151 RepID=A0A6M5YRK3_9BACT|nr:hypothetical protein FTUN_4175 [Frigoriglobus tundricola]
MDSESWEQSRNLQKMIRSVDPRQCDRKLRLFAVACCRRVWDLITDPAAKRLVELTEQFADGAIDREALRNVWSGAPDYPRADGAAKQAAAFGCASWEAAADSYTRAAHDAEAAVAEAIDEPDSPEVGLRKYELRGRERAAQLDLLREVLRNPFRSVSFSPTWRTETAVLLARQMYESRDFSAMPILADALQDAGCDHTLVLDHCRDPGQIHVRGCWVVDLVLGKS